MSARSAPAVRIELKLEATPRIHLVAATDDDEQRLRGWLERSPVIEQVQHALGDLAATLNRLDELGWTVDDLRGRLNRVRPRGRVDWLAACPVCRRQSLAVHEHGDRVLLTCFDGCSLEEIMVYLSADDTTENAA